jgi:hypothetical protein
MKKTMGSVQKATKMRRKAVTAMAMTWSRTVRPHLDANGRLEVEFTVPPPDEKDPWDFTYRLEAQVTDSARRMIEGRASFVGTRGNVVATAQPERYVYYQGDTARIKVMTASYEGRPVPVKGDLEVCSPNLGQSRDD